jgi:hypothetical protein
MGEHFKRKKADAFRHQQDERYDDFCAADLLSEARKAVLQSEYDAAFVTADAGTPPGAVVQLRREADGSVGVVRGSTIIGRVCSQSVGELLAVLDLTGGLMVAEVGRRSAFGSRFTVRVTETRDGDGPDA